MKFLLNKKVIGLVLVGTVLAGCNDITGPKHDADWFKAHKNERTEVLKICINNPKELKDSTNCKNAVVAEIAVEKQAAKAALESIFGASNQ